MKSFLPLIRLFLVLTLIAPAAFIGEPVQAADALPVVQAGDAPSHASDRILIKFALGVAPRATVQGAPATGHASLDGLLSAYQVQAAHRLFKSAPESDPVGLARIHVLRLKPETDLDTLLALLETDPNVEWVEPDYLAFAAATIPNDPLFTDQWGLAKIQAPSAWDVTTGSATVPIAIVDSGIDFSHPDLSGKLWVNPGEIAGNGLDDDNNGYVDDVQGWDLVNADNLPADDNGHGTQVAGIAAASTNNSAGIAGVCWACRIMPVKVMQASGVANYSDIAAGVLYAAQKGARVINLSLGGYSYSSALDAAIQAATGTYGAVVVAGAGNDNLSTPFYPAAYPEVLAVAGTDPADAKAALSNYGAWVDVSAPAVGIKTTFMGGDYGDVDGTSYDAPFVAGVAGLLRSQNPDWSPDMVRAQVIHTADDIDPLNLGLEGQLGSGRVNADQAVSTPAQPLLSLQGYTVDGVASGRPEPGSTVDLVVTLYNDWADASSVQATLSSSSSYVTMVTGSASFGDIPPYGSGANTTPFRFSISASAPYAHNLALSLNVTAGGGYSAAIPLTIQTTSSVVIADATLTTQTWTNDRIYVINKETGIPEGNTLTIEPGTEIRFDGYYSLSVLGTLIADGTEEQPIVFTSNKSSPTAGDWRQLKFLDSAVDASFDGTGNYLGGSILRHAIVEYGHGVNLQDAAPFISQNTVQYTIGSGIGGNGSPGLVIADNTITGGDSADTTFIGMELSIWSGDFSVVGNTVSHAMGGIHVFGPGLIAENKVQQISELGISTQGPLTVTANRVVECGEGIFVDGGSISGNLVAYNDGNGLRINGGAPTVISNTVVSNGQAGVYIEGGAPNIRHNNLIAPAGNYALYNNTANDITATNNWWGTTNNAAIDALIYDDNESYGLGVVDYSGYLAGPEQTAPAYVTGVHISPDTTLGIQTATFEVNFSRPMDQSIAPELGFRSLSHGTWTTYNTSNSGLPHNTVLAISVDPDGSLWFGTYAGVAHFDGSNWTVYNTANSGLPEGHVGAIATDPDGSLWFGTWNGGVAHFDGLNWTVYNTSNSQLPADTVQAIATDPDDSHWFGTPDGVAQFDGAEWTVYNTANSGLPDDSVWAIATDPDGSHWFGTWSGVAHFGSNWTVYNTANSGLPDNSVQAIAIGPDGSPWFGTQDGGAAHFGSNWMVYNTANSGLPDNYVTAISTGLDGSHWFGTFYGGVAHFDGSHWTVYNTANSGLPRNYVHAIATGLDGSHWLSPTEFGVAVLWNKPFYPIKNNTQWLDDHIYGGTYDITSLIERGEYLVHVSGAVGTDGLEIVPAAGYPFTVDYAGAIGDTSPPPVPAVEACASTTVGTLSASWSAHDPDSTITLYSYAIGTTPGGGEVVNWTNTTATSFTRTGLGLIAGHTYYIAVKARNEGGLWSEAGIPAGLVAGSGTCTTNIHSVHLPVILRNR